MEYISIFVLFTQFAGMLGMFGVTKGKAIQGKTRQTIEGISFKLFRKALDICMKCVV